MKLALLAFGTTMSIAGVVGFVQPAMANDDDVSIGLKLGPLCVGLCIEGDRNHHRNRDYRRCDDFDCEGGFYSHREDFYHQRYDRRDSYDEYAGYRDDGYAGYRRHRRDHDNHNRRSRDGESED